MKRLGRLLLLIPLLSLLWALPAWAVGTQFSGNCTTLSWNADTDADLAGYRLYDRTLLSNPYTQIAQVGPQITSLPCSQFNFNAGQHYFSMTAFDTSGNESAHSTEVPFFIVSTATNQIQNLTVTIVNATDMTLSFTEVDGGTGLPASYDVRMNTPTINWGTANSVASGTCSTPLAGTTIGATKTCTVTGLSTTTAYQFQLVPYRGTLGVDAVFGPLSNITGATTGGAPPAVTTKYTIFSDSFTRPDDALGLGVNYDTGVYHDDAHVLDMPNLQIVTNAVRRCCVDGATSALATVNSVGGIFPNSQWVQVTVKTLTASNYVIPWIGLGSASPPAFTEYDLQFNASPGLTHKTELVKIVAGVKTVLAFESVITWAATDVLLFEKVWDPVALTNTLTATRNGVVILTYVDSVNPIIAGRPSMGIYLSSSRAESDSELDNLSAGGYTTAAPTDVCGCDSH